jgi:hypothetical protein
MFASFAALCYRSFLSSLGRWGRDQDHNEPLQPDPAFEASFGDQHTFETVDRLATKLGEEYRGMGVLCGGFGMLVVLLALMPYMVGRPDDMVLTALKALESVLMLVIVVLVVSSRRRGMKLKWIRTRMYAEKLRYQSLRDAVEALKQPSNNTPVAIQKEVARLLSEGQDSQLEYNRGKVHRYEAIETSVKKLTYSMFAFSLLGAVIALMHASWETALAQTNPQLKPSLLLIPLALAPAFVGVLHGIVAFLRLPQLIGQHELVVQELEGLQKCLRELQSRQATQQATTSEWEALGKDLLTTLTRGDTAWTGIARCQDVHPV